MRHFQLLISNILIFTTVSLLSSCAPKAADEHQFANHYYFNKSFCMQVPSNWPATVIPLVWHDVPDKLSIIDLKQSENCGVRIKYQRQKNRKMQDISSQHILDIYESSRKTANIIMVRIDSLNNNMLIDYIIKPNANECEKYYRNYFIINKDLWINMDFSGPNSKGFRDTVSTMTRSASIQ